MGLSSRDNPYSFIKRPPCRPLKRGYKMKKVLLILILIIGLNGMAKADIPSNNTDGTVMIPIILVITAIVVMITTQDYSQNKSNTVTYKEE